MARACGGCQLQELDYREQLRFKERKVYNHLKRIGGMDRLFLPEDREKAAGVPNAVVMEPIIGMEDPWRYRNKAQYPVGLGKDGQPAAGFYAGRTHSLIPAPGLDCLLGCQENKELLKIILDFMKEYKIPPYDEAGFYAGRTHSLIPAPGLDCLLGCQENKELLKIILDFMKEYKIPPYDEAAHQGLVRHVLLRKGFSSGGLMVCLVINGEELPHGGELAERLRAAGVSSVSYSVNMERTNVIMGTRIVNLYGPGYITDTIGDIEYRISPLSFYQVNPVQTEKLERTNVIMGTRIVNLYGPGYITDTIGDIEYRISPLSFYQVNPVQTEKLYGTALEFADLSGGETVWDLYCGIGTISSFLAKKAGKVYGVEIIPQALYGTALEFADLSGGETVWDLYCGIGTISSFLAKKAGKVYGVEIIPQAIEDARENARRNGIENVEFFVGKAEEVLPEQYERNHVRADVIVVDPPRKGCDPVCLETILKMAPERVVYVSCDSATLARDVKFLEENGYRATRVRPVDMFPMGGHCECVVKLERVGK